MKAADSAEFLGLVPALAGFTPRQSMVLVPFQASRAHGAMRIDLPGDGADADEYVDTAIALVSRVSGMDAVAVVVYTDELPLHTPDGMILPETVLVEDLLALATDTGLRIVDALCVMSCGWSSYFDLEPELSPLDEIPEPPSFPGIEDLTTDQSAGAGVPAADLAERERVGRALRDISDVLANEGGPHRAMRENPQALDAMLLLDDLPLFFESLIEHPEEPSPFVTATLLWCLERPIFRDVALLQWAKDLSTGIRAFDAQLEFSSNGRCVPEDLGELFLGRGPAPDPVRLRTALGVVREAAARAPRDSRPAPLTLAAWISWALGRSTHAQCYLDLVLEIDPVFSLARLLSTLMDAAVLPEWTFHRGSGLQAG